MAKLLACCRTTFGSGGTDRTIVLDDEGIPFVIEEKWGMLSGDSITPLSPDAPELKRNPIACPEWACRILRVAGYLATFVSPEDIYRGAVDSNDLTILAQAVKDVGGAGTEHDGFHSREANRLITELENKISKIKRDAAWAADLPNRMKFYQERGWECPG